MDIVQEMFTLKMLYAKEKRCDTQPYPIYIDVVVTLLDPVGFSQEQFLCKQPEHRNLNSDVPVCSIGFNSKKMCIRLPETCACLILPLISIGFTLVETWLRLGCHSKS